MAELGSELDSLGCRSIVTTHIGDLKTYAFTNPRAENAAVEFDLETLQPRYRLHIGDIGQSNALQIARRIRFSVLIAHLGLPRSDQIASLERKIQLLAIAAGDDGAMQSGQAREPDHGIDDLLAA